MRYLVGLLLLAGCKANPVEVTCSYEYTFDSGEESGSYLAWATDCETWAEAGSQVQGSYERECVQDGLDRGAFADCTCTHDTGRCTFPNGVND